jgi:hypothetical protein
MSMYARSTCATSRTVAATARARAAALSDLDQIEDVLGDVELDLVDRARGDLGLEIDLGRPQHRRRRDVRRGDAERVVLRLQPAVRDQRDLHAGIAIERLFEERRDRGRDTWIGVVVPRRANADAALDLAIDRTEDGAARRHARREHEHEELHFHQTHMTPSREHGATEVHSR